MTEEVDYFALVEEAWALSDSARKYRKEKKELGLDVSIQDYVDNVFIPSGKVDLKKCSEHITEHPPKIFLNSPYGLQFRPEFNDWIPFRHGEIKIDLDFLFDEEQSNPQ
jgi:hypothetical protein